MRKILASFLAASMVASIAATMSFAAGTNATFELKPSGNVTTDNEGDGIAAGSATITLNINDSTETFVFRSNAPIDKNITGGAATNNDVLEAFDGEEATVDIDGTIYTARLQFVPGASSSATGSLKGTISPAGAVSFRFGSVSIGPRTADTTLTDFTNNTIGFDGTPNYGTGGVHSVADGTDMYAEQAIYCDTGKIPVPLVESSGDRNGSDGVRSGATVYFAVNMPYGDPDLFKVKASKGSNAKNVDKIEIVEKRFSKNLVRVSDGAELTGTGGVRRSYIKVELKELFTDDEYKITFDLKITPKTKALDKAEYANFKEAIIDEDDISTVWLKNAEASADNDWKVGTEGLMLNPLVNDWNNVTWFDEDGDVAHMKFFADSDVKKFYSKLSTKWEHADYASYFNDQDAYVFDFTGSPKLSSTSRADLEIYNPFVDEDGNETIDPETAIIYQIIDGDLFEVTDNFVYEEAESGDMAFKTRTRFLGTYVICEKKIEEAVDGDAPDTDLVPEDTTPVEVTPGNDDGGKAPANTGKYL